MGLASRLRANLRRLRSALLPMRRRGFGWAGILAWVLPSAVALRAWRRLARPVNGRLLGPWLNGPALASFQAQLPAFERMPLVVIVMPQVLHFLLPCLALLRGHLPLVLVANGAQDWELELLRTRVPEAPQLRLRCLPGTSVDHGDVITLLIEHLRGPFGIVDHDCYVFDAGLLDRLAPEAGECMVALFADEHPHLTFALPLTHALALDPAPLRQLMHESGVDARVARHAPPAVRAALTRLGLVPGAHLKPYQHFHDTLHLLLVLALDRGSRLRVPHSDAEQPLVHIGGTSIGSHHTKSLFALYVHLLFLELVDDERLRRGYAHLTRPLRSAAEVLQRRGPDDAGWDALPLLDATMPRLRDALQRAWPRHPSPAGADPS